MDGFAVRSADTATAAADSNVTLSVAADIPAGSNPQLTLAQDGPRVAKLTGHQGSGSLLSLIQANALLIIPAGVKCVPADREVDAWLL